MKIITATARARIWGTRNHWSLSPFRAGGQTSTECDVLLEIQGDLKHGYNLVQRPDGFFTADSHLPTLEDALKAAEELYAVPASQWTAMKRR